MYMFLISNFGTVSSSIQNVWYVICSKPTTPNLIDSVTRSFKVMGVLLITKTPLTSTAHSRL